MDHIIINFQPFSLEQDVFVYIDGKCIYQTKTTIDKFSSVVKGLKDKYDINKIDLCGNQEYLSRFKAELSLAFSKDNTEINIYQR